MSPSNFLRPVAVVLGRHGRRGMSQIAAGGFQRLSFNRLCPQVMFPESFTQALRDGFAHVSTPYRVKTVGIAIGIDVRAVAASKEEWPVSDSGWVSF